MRYIITLMFMAILSSTSALAEPPRLYDPETGKYLGTLSSNPYDRDSVSNPYGRYGSEYSADSINNKYGVYGSPYSNKSANNPYARSAPVIIDSDR